MDGFADAQMQAALAAARSGPAQPGKAATPDQARQVAEEFEAVFLAQMMEHMFGETTKNTMFSGPGESAFQGMLTEEYAKVTARSGGMGLADALTREILALQEAGAADEGESS
mgnify:CR=1 FL=1